MNEVLDLACQLIARPSVTPQDAGCLELTAARLAPLGFAAERIDRGGVANLWARRGAEAPLLCFAGYTDVVPPGPRGIDQILRHPGSPRLFEPSVKSAGRYVMLAEDASGTIPRNVDPT